MRTAAGGQRSFDDLGTPLADVTFCVLDIETTGGDRHSDLITEIGMVKVRAGACLGTLQTLINPGRAIPPMITMLTGISESMVVRAPAIDAVLPAMIEFLGDAVIVGHNVGFDMAFINSTLVRRGDAEITNPVIDTLPLARRLIRDEVPDCRLGTLAARFRLDHRPSHRALDDALATTDLLHFLLERAAGLGVLGLDDLIALPRIGAHPQAGKLRMTSSLPRTPGVYLFRGANDQVLYVGKATNLRQRVRSYFGSDDRRKIGTLLREAQRVTYVATPNVLTAEVLELRYLQQLTPRYNKVGTAPQRYRYVRLSTDEAWPRLSVVSDAKDAGVHLGPLAIEGQRRRGGRGTAVGLPAAPVHDPARPHVPAPPDGDHVHPGAARGGDVPVRRRGRCSALRGSGRQDGAGHDDLTRSRDRRAAGPALHAVGGASLRGGWAGPRPRDCLLQRRATTPAHRAVT